MKELQQVLRRQDSNATKAPGGSGGALKLNKDLTAKGTGEGKDERFFFVWSRFLGTNGCFSFIFVSVLFRCFLRIWRRSLNMQKNKS